jgi:hypothetical protein
VTDANRQEETATVGLKVWTDCRRDKRLQRCVDKNRVDGITAGITLSWQLDRRQRLTLTHPHSLQSLKSALELQAATVKHFVKILASQLCCAHRAHRFKIHARRGRLVALDPTARVPSPIAIARSTVDLPSATVFVDADLHQCLFSSLDDQCTLKCDVVQCDGVVQSARG